MGYIPREDRGKEMLEPDIMTPVQFFGALRRRSWQDGERRLMSAVLQDGIETFQKHAFSTDELGKALFEEAQRWVSAKFDRSLFSFTSVCEILDIDAEYLRAGLFRWRESQQPVGLELGGKLRSTEAPSPDRGSALVRTAKRVVNGS